MCQPPTTTAPALDLAAARNIVSATPTCPACGRWPAALVRNAAGAIRCHSCDDDNPLTGPIRAAALCDEADAVIDAAEQAGA